VDGLQPLQKTVNGPLDESYRVYSSSLR